MWERSYHLAFYKLIPYVAYRLQFFCYFYHLVFYKLVPYVAYRLEFLCYFSSISFYVNCGTSVAGFISLLVEILIE